MVSSCSRDTGCPSPRRITPDTQCGGGVALHDLGAVDLGDSGRVADLGIDAHGLIAKPEIEGLQHALDQLGRIGVVRQIDRIEQVRPVSAVGEIRRGPAEFVRELRGDPVGQRDRRRVLVRARGNPARSDRIEIDQQPAPAQDVRIAGRGFGALDRVVLRAGQEHGIHRVERGVNPRQFSVEPQRRIDELL